MYLTYEGSFSMKFVFCHVFMINTGAAGVMDRRPHLSVVWNRNINKPDLSWEWSPSGRTWMWRQKLSYQVSSPLVAAINNSERPVQPFCQYADTPMLRRKYRWSDNSTDTYVYAYIVPIYCMPDAVCLISLLSCSRQCVAALSTMAAGFHLHLQWWLVAMIVENDLA